MKHLLLACALIICTSVYPQFVGIGTTTPMQPLDVQGNVNINGALQANGISAQPGQVLSAGNNGKISWSDMGTAFGFSRFVSFENIVGIDSADWIIPEGVSKLMIEAWGGGGGGSTSVGGGGGGYVIGHFPVKPGSKVTIKLGNGGVGAAAGSYQHGENGKPSIVHVTDTMGKLWYVVGFGGSGGYSNSPGLEFTNTHVFGGHYFVIDQNPRGTLTPSVKLYPAFTGVMGEPGTASTFTYVQVGGSSFAQQIFGGKGGNAGNSINTGGIAPYYLFVSNNPYVVNRSLGLPGRTGGGGASGIATYGGSAGGSGRVTIWY